MKALAFASFASGCLRLRASAAATSASKIPAIVPERVRESTAEIAWPLATATGPFRVLYGPAGQPLTSLRTTWLTSVKLRNLKPGCEYEIHVHPDVGVAKFTTVESDQSMAANMSATEAPAKDGAASGAPITELSRLEIRVGRVLECENHPDADSLYVEKVDCGEAEPRTIVSGLVKYVPKEALVGRSVIVLCNLKPRSMRGVTSFGMLLCASNDEHSVVDPLAAPDGAAPGEMISFAGHCSAPVEAGNRATKAFDRVASELRTSTDGIAMYKDVPFETSQGPVFSPKKIHGSIS